MPKKTQKEIDAEIKRLEKCKTYAPHYTMFGGDNHRKIDEQIGALANKLTHDDAYDNYPDDEDPEVLSSVISALDWRNGDEEQTPSSGWDIFDPKKKKKKARA